MHPLNAARRASRSCGSTTSTSSRASLPSQESSSAKSSCCAMSKGARWPGHGAVCRRSLLAIGTMRSSCLKPMTQSLTPARKGGSANCRRAAAASEEGSRRGYAPSERWRRSTRTLQQARGSQRRQAFGDGSRRACGQSAWRRCASACPV